MKSHTYIGPILSLAPLLMAALLSGCSVAPAEEGGIASAPNDSAEVVQARSVLRDEVEKTPLVRNMQFDVKPDEMRDISYTDPRNNAQESVQLVLVLPDSINVTYSHGNAMEIPAWKVTYTQFVDMRQYFWLSSSWSQGDAQSAADALKILVLDARRDADSKLAANLERFKGTCQGGAAQTPMPEEASQHVAAAERAYQSGDKDTAGDEYQAALTLYPCWPEGLYKRANILGQTGWYPPAIDSMKRYLFLVPNDPNAASLQSQIRDWQSRMGG